MFRGSVQNLGNSDLAGNYDLVYYTADIINSNPSNVSANNDPPVSFQETRATPIIRNTREYEFSIIRFQVNGCGKNLPIFIPNIAIGVDNFWLRNSLVQSPIDGFFYLCIKTVFGSTDPSLDPTNWQLYSKTNNGYPLNKPFILNGIVLYYTGTWMMGAVYSPQNDPNSRTVTPYIIGLNANINGISLYVEIPIIYIPEDKTAPLPQVPITAQDVTSSYYYVYTYEHWVNIVNNSFVILMNQLKAKALQQGITLTAFPPFMTYEASSSLFNIYYDTEFFGILFGGTHLKTNWIDLVSNNNFYGLFSAFNTSEIIPALPNKQPIVYIVENKLNTNIWIPNTFTGFPTLAGSYYKMAQNFVNTSSMWNPISSIVFTSGQIPVVNETQSAPLKYGSTNIDSSTISNSFTPTIADIALDIKKADGYSNLIYYEPNGEFRMASMLGGSNGELTNIDIRVFWKNRLDNRLYPLRMFNFSNVSMKMLFRKKK
jgi:hypothetical protein